MATDPDDAEPTLSSTAMHEGMTKEGSGLPDEGEQCAGKKELHCASVKVQQKAYLRSQASYNPFRYP